MHGGCSFSREDKLFYSYEINRDRDVRDGPARAR